MYKSASIYVHHFKITTSNLRTYTAHIVLPGVLLLKSQLGYLDNDTGPLSMRVRGDDEKFRALKTRSKVGSE